MTLLSNVKFYVEDFSKFCGDLATFIAMHVKIEIKIYASKRISTLCATVIDPNDQCNLGHTYLQNFRFPNGKSHNKNWANEQGI